MHCRNSRIGQDSNLRTPLRKENTITTELNRIFPTTVVRYYINPLPHMPTLESSNSATNKDMMSEI